MHTKRFQTLVVNEDKTFRYFRNLCWKNYRFFCIRCKGKKIYRLKEKRYRCGRCGYTFSDFTGRWIGRLKIRSSEWLWIIKFFELEISARKASQQISLSYPTVLKAEQAEGTKNLLQLQVKIGDEERQIIAGIAQWYSPDEIVGKKIIVVANLKPAENGVIAHFLGLLHTILPQEGHFSGLYEAPCLILGVKFLLVTLSLTL